MQTEENCGRSKREGINMKAATIALVVRYDGPAPELVETLADDREIAVLEAAYVQGAPNPLESIAEHRVRVAKEEEDFGNYVEDLLSHQFLRPEIQEHGLQWLNRGLFLEHANDLKTKRAKGRYG